MIDTIALADRGRVDWEMSEACRAACIHDEIAGFMQGYRKRVS